MTLKTKPSGKGASLRRAALAAALAGALAGCATVPNPRDPYEGFNRAVFRFNDAIDENAL
ncbi:MAG: VacJ family lipoprotein, partial [Burkholderiaceae bacterium]|nr:VacJ family lipoprotein [Burkholderiaceae bacterium]